jgi:uncharacterized protein (DUF302 family)
MESRYGFGREVALTFSEARSRVTEALAAEGFGVLTEVDVAATFKRKLNLDSPPYVILGACNPAFAHRAMSADPSIGLLLPCNVVVREDTEGTVHVEALDPVAMFSLVDAPGVEPLANEVRARLKHALDAV